MNIEEDLYEADLQTAKQDYTDEEWDELSTDEQKDLIVQAELDRETRSYMNAEYYATTF